MDLESFYNSILNIGNKDKYNDIVKIVKEKKARLLENTDSLDGFCKYLANQIEYEIKTNLSGVWVNSIDLNELVQVDHVVLLAEYHNNDDMKRLLIDPTFSQFTKPSDKKLVGLASWPSENLDESFRDKLLTDGVVEVDDTSFNRYLDSFGNHYQDINLDRYLRDRKADKIK